MLISQITRSSAGAEPTPSQQRFVHLLPPGSPGLGIPRQLAPTAHKTFIFHLSNQLLFKTHKIGSSAPARFESVIRGTSANVPRSRPFCVKGEDGRTYPLTPPLSPVTNIRLDANNLIPGLADTCRGLTNAYRGFYTQASMAVAFHAWATTLNNDLDTPLLHMDKSTPETEMYIHNLAAKLINFVREKVHVERASAFPASQRSQRGVSSSGGPRGMIQGKATLALTPKHSETPAAVLAARLQGCCDSSEELARVVKKGDNSLVLTALWTWTWVFTEILKLETRKKAEPLRMVAIGSHAALLELTCLEYQRDLAAGEALGCNRDMLTELSVTLRREDEEAQSLKDRKRKREDGMADEVAKKKAGNEQVRMKG